MEDQDEPITLVSLGQVIRFVDISVFKSCKCISSSQSVL